LTYTLYIPGRYMNDDRTQEPIYIKVVMLNCRSSTYLRATSYKKFKAMRFHI